VRFYFLKIGSGTASDDVDSAINLSSEGGIASHDAFGHGFGTRCKRPMDRPSPTSEALPKSGRVPHPITRPRKWSGQMRRPVHLSGVSHRKVGQTVGLALSARIGASNANRMHIQPRIVGKPDSALHPGVCGAMRTGVSSHSV